MTGEGAKAGWETLALASVYEQYSRVFCHAVGVLLMSHQLHLLCSRRFLPLFITQFCGALNDNLLKNAMVVLLTFHTAQWTTLSVSVLANLAGGVFILPFFLFSATAGQLADKYDKARLARLSKVLEIVIVLVAGAGLFLHNLALLMVSLFLLGAQSTLFGPVKYAVLPQHLRAEELVGGNALIEAGTFVSILVGTLLGGLLAGMEGATWVISVAGLVVALAGYAACRMIPSAPPPAPELKVNWNVASETWRNIRFVAQDGTVFRSILGGSWFWLYGAVMLAQFSAYAKDCLGGNETVVTMLLAVFTVGIGAGSMLCERLSGGRVELGLVPLGSIGLTVFGLDLFFASPASAPAGTALVGAGTLLAQAATWRILLDLVLLGAFGGLFIVPLYALIQQRSEEAHRARVIAANNIFNALFMVVGALGAGALLSAGMSIPALFAVVALCNAAVAFYIYRLVPEFLVRFLLWGFTHFRRTACLEGEAWLPARGGVVLVPDRALTAEETLALLALCRRPLRCVLPTAQDGTRRMFRFILRQSRAIATDGHEGRAVEQALAAGQPVCYTFPPATLPANAETVHVHFAAGEDGILRITLSGAAEQPN